MSLGTTSGAVTLPIPVPPPLSAVAQSNGPLGQLLRVAGVKLSGSYGGSSDGVTLEGPLAAAVRAAAPCAAHWQRWRLGGLGCVAAAARSGSPPAPGSLPAPCASLLPPVFRRIHCRSGGQPTCTASPRWSSSCAWRAAGRRCALSALRWAAACLPLSTPRPSPCVMQPCSHALPTALCPWPFLCCLQAASKQLREVLAEAAGRGSSQR